MGSYDNTHYEELMSDTPESSIIECNTAGKYAQYYDSNTVSPVNFFDNYNHINRAVNYNHVNRDNYTIDINEQNYFTHVPVPNFRLLSDVLFGLFYCACIIGYILLLIP